MVARIFLAIGAVCVVVLTIVVVIAEDPWAPRPAQQPSATVRFPYSGPHATEDEAMRRFLSGPLPPLRGYKQW